MSVATSGKVPDGKPVEDSDDTISEIVQIVGLFKGKDAPRRLRLIECESLIALVSSLKESNVPC